LFEKITIESLDQSRIGCCLAGVVLEVNETKSSDYEAVKTISGDSCGTTTYLEDFPRKLERNY
jgi:hypothetical protein